MAIGTWTLLFVASTPAANSRVKLYGNDGRGRFTDLSATHLPALPAGSLAAADVDGDGDVDLVVGSVGALDSLLLNDGTGRFVDAPGRLPQPGGGPATLRFADVDKDGDADLFLGYADYPISLFRVRLYLNDGTGRFTDASATHVPSGSMIALALATGDLDADGDLDLLVGCSGSGQRHRVLINDGSGRFSDETAVRLPDAMATSFSVALVDVDQDGDLDLFASTATSTLVLYLNDGTGHFQLAKALVQVMITSIKHLVVADLDEDGDADLLTDQVGLFNRHRQLQAPFLARPGQPFVLRAHFSRGPGSGAAWGFTMVAGGRGHLPLPPYGVFGLDAASAVPLGGTAINQPAGIGDQAFLMPADRALLGSRLFFQGLVVPVGDPLGARLTNVLIETVLPH
jgi:hypothetical protein